MIFKNLEDLFNEKVNELYGDKTLRDPSALHPIITIKPNDPDKDVRRNDSYSNPAESVKIDEKRMKKYLDSPYGKKLIQLQDKLQSKNPISETRKLSKDFILGNLDSSGNIRSKETQKDMILAGSGKSPASTKELGYAGRLQKSTSSSSIRSATGTLTGSKLLEKAIKKTGINKVFGNEFSTEFGTLGVNKRPELDVNGQYYIVMMWNKNPFLSTEQRLWNSLEKDLQNVYRNNFLRVENRIKDNIKNSIRNFVTSKLFPVRSGVEARISSKTSSIGNFIQGKIFKTSSGSIFGQTVKDIFKETINGVKRAATDSAQQALARMISRSPLSGLFGNLFSTRFNINPLKYNDDFTQNYFIQNEKKEENVTYLKNGFVIQNNYPYFPSKHGFSGIAAAGSFWGISGYNAVPSILMANSSYEQMSRPTVEDNFTYPKLSLRSWYESTEIGAILSSTKDEYQKSLQQLGSFGIVGGLNIDDLNEINSYDDFQRRTATVGSRRYYAESPSGTVARAGAIHDRLNMLPPRLDNIPDEDETTDLVDFIIEEPVTKDTTKKTKIRALITGLTESSVPTYNESNYIGRVERNVVYSSVVRDIGFTLNLHALTADELFPIWQKVNYLTSLTYPIEYANGHIVPPIIKLTIGNIHQGLPGYISNLSYTVDDNVSWEIAAGHQVPHGVTVNISFKVLELTRMTRESAFYGYGNIDKGVPISLNDIKIAKKSVAEKLERLQDTIRNPNVPKDLSVSSIMPIISKVYK